jgi:hypothetical protein
MKNEKDKKRTSFRATNLRHQDRMSTTKINPNGKKGRPDETVGPGFSSKNLLHFRLGKTRAGGLRKTPARLGFTTCYFAAAAFILR